MTNRRLEKMSKLISSVSPHFYGRRTTRNIMLDVIIALMPAVIASAIIFGWRSLLVTGVCVMSCVAFEFLFERLCKKEITINDLSAIVTGILLAFNLPVSIPLWQAILGCLFAIVVVKQLFGGIGQNFANPAITARIALMASFSGSMTNWVYPATSKTPDAVSSATPLTAVAKGTEEMMPDYLTLFLGNHSGCLGETCALALVLGGIYLLVRRVITWHTPVMFIGIVALMSLACGKDPLYQVLSGGLLLGALFMATDYSTTPDTKPGQIVFGLGCGLITVLIRFWGNLPEGVSFSILLMNILTPYISRITKSNPLTGGAGT